MVTGRDGAEERGSGYLVRAGVVLTAAHVVRDVRSVRVRFNHRESDEQTVCCGADSVLVAAGGDVAVVVLPAGAGPESVEPAGFGRVSRRAAVLPCQVVGFPRFKLKADAPCPEGAGAGGSWFRDRAQVEGRIPVLANSKEGTLEVLTEPPADDLDATRSPWEGMSGAAVWAADGAH